MPVLSGLYRIIGPPGCGKTTRIASSVEKIASQGSPRYDGSSPVLVVSLTRTAAREAAGRDLPIPEEAVGTLHAMAYRALGRPQLAEQKLPDFVESTSGLYELASSRSFDEPEDVGNMGQLRSHGEDPLQSLNLHRARCEPRDLWPNAVQGFEADYTAWKAEAGLSDFTDLIERAVNYPPPLFPGVIIVDEAQDLSRLEWRLVQAWGERAGALVIVGDPRQALYTWRGADPAIFTEPIGERREDILGQSYRVPKIIVEGSQRLAEGLSDWRAVEYAPRRENGSQRPADGFCERFPADWKRNPQAIVDKIEEILPSGQSCMVAGGCSWHLDPICRIMRDRGLPFANRWRTHNGAWNPLRKGKGSTVSRLESFLQFDAGSHEGKHRLWTWREFRLWIDALRVDGTLKRGAKTAIRNIAEPDSTAEEATIDLSKLPEWFEPQPLADLFSILDARFHGEKNIRPLLTWFEDRVLPDKANSARYLANVIASHGLPALRSDPKIYVGTIHSFKGSEADNVFLFPDLSPSSFLEWKGQPDQRDSIIRQFYVGLTRAREGVFLCNPQPRERRFVPLWRYFDE